MATAPLIPGLVDDAVEEILLRLPPEDPAALVRAALVSNGWRRLVSSPGFRRRFREFHRAPLMLGFLTSQGRFESATSFRPRYAYPKRVQIRRALDARHGRVLLSRYSAGSARRDSECLVVWNPVRGDLQKLPTLHHWFCDGWTAALVCAAAAGGCDHLDCAARGRPFRVVLVGTYRLRLVTASCVYSSEAGAWSSHYGVTRIPPPDPLHLRGPSVLVGNALYFRCATGILKYDLETATQRFEITRVPTFFMDDHDAILTTTEDGNLGSAFIQQSKLVMWSREAPIDIGNKEDARWVQSRVIELGDLLPVNTLLDSARLVGFADRIAVILVQIVDRWRLFTIDIKSSRVKEIGKGLDIDGYHVVIPFVSFCIPALEAPSSCVGPSASASSTSHP